MRATKLYRYIPGERRRQESGKTQTFRSQGYFGRARGNSFAGSRKRSLVVAGRPPLGFSFLDFGIIFGKASGGVARHSRPGCNPSHTRCTEMETASFSKCVVFFEGLCAAMLGLVAPLF
jgi:hypothetical protein